MIKLNTTYKKDIKEILSELKKGDITFDDAEEHLIHSTESQLEAFGRVCFYDGRVQDGVNGMGHTIFTRPTYNGFLRELDKNDIISL